MSDPSAHLFKNFNRIIFASYVGLILISIYLFRMEYEGDYQDALAQVDLYFHLGDKVFAPQTFQGNAHPIIKKEMGMFGIMDESGQFIKILGKKLPQPIGAEKFFPPSLQRRADLLTSLPERRRERIGDYWIYKSSLEQSGRMFVAYIKVHDVQKKAFYEAVDTLYSIIGSLTILLIVVYILINREFIRPAKALVGHLAGEAKGISNPPDIHEAWREWNDTITNVFAENRRLVEDLEDHIKNLDHKVLQRTDELRDKNQRLEEAIHDLKTAQDQIIFQEKMASLGSLTAGIAHEMKNPLNFVINFSEVSQELIQDLLEFLKSLTSQFPDKLQGEIKDLTNDLTKNMSLIREHGQRADHIVRSMLLHAHGGDAEWQPVSINQLLIENIDLALSGFKGSHQGFHVHLKTHLDEANPLVFASPGDLGRVCLNILSNSCYALWERLKWKEERYEPHLIVMTQELESKIEIRVRDNGTGIPEVARRKIFEPFFTTKPVGQGTGLGLSMCYDIITRLGGSIDIDTQEGQYTEFIIYLPKQGQHGNTA